ncbi:hypothetical protein [Azotosporobacter soli]|uniref:hypothetical protein n=1 Tax=Azotosporobacter soli TaxID=3055040 RepID=UPI0031FE76CA
MKRINAIVLSLTVAFVCLMPINAQALLSLDDSLYNHLYNGAASDNYNKGAVLIYRGWNTGPLGYKTEMIKAIPHMNIVNLTGETLKITAATGCFKAPNLVNNVSLVRSNNQSMSYAYAFDLVGSTSKNPSGYIGSDDNNDNPGPAGTAQGDNQWWKSLSDSGAACDLTMSVGSHSFNLHVDWGNNYNALEVAHADLVTMSLRDVGTNQYASYLVNNGVINRGLVYLNGYTDSSGKPFEVFLVAGDRTNITFLVKYVN